MSEIRYSLDFDTIYFALTCALMGGVNAGGILQTKSWLHLLAFWAIIAAIAIPICFIGAKQWDRGKRVLEENV